MESIWISSPLVLTHTIGLIVFAVGAEVVDGVDEPITEVIDSPPGIAIGTSGNDDSNSVFGGVDRAGTSVFCEVLLIVSADVCASVATSELAGQASMPTCVAETGLDEVELFSETDSNHGSTTSWKVRGGDTAPAPTEGRVILERAGLDFAPTTRRSTDALRFFFKAPRTLSVPRFFDGRNLSRTAAFFAEVLNPSLEVLSSAGGCLSFCTGGSARESTGFGEALVEERAKRMLCKWSLKAVRCICEGTRRGAAVGAGSSRRASV
jgi:hypothetical protein